MSNLPSKIIITPQAQAAIHGRLGALLDRLREKGWKQYSWVEVDGYVATSWRGGGPATAVWQLGEEEAPPGFAF